MTRKLLRLTILISGLAFSTTVSSAGAAQVARPPGGCNSSFNPYDYTQAEVQACGYKTFPMVGRQTLPDGGTAYEYDVDGTIGRYSVEPAGFDPAVATAAELDRYGFPHRPADPNGSSRWNNEMSHWHGSAPAPPFLAEANARVEPALGLAPAGTNGTADSVTAGNWSGYGITGSNITSVDSTYEESPYYGSGCSSTAAVDFAGIGGWSTGDPLGQDGTAYVTGGAITGIGNHQTWWEVTTETNRIIPLGMYAHPYYYVDATTDWTGSGYQFYIYDSYSGNTESYFEPGSSTDYSGDSGEAIAERPSVWNGSHWVPTNLSNFGAMPFRDNYENGVAFDQITSGRHGIHMFDSSGSEMATPSGISTYGYFSDQQDRCS